MDDLGTPSSYLTLEGGEPVYSCDGEELGKVKRVVADMQADIFDGLDIDQGFLGGSDRFVEGEQVEEIFERGVLLKIDAAAAAELPAPRGQESN